MRTTIIVEAAEDVLKILNENKGKIIFFKVIGSNQNYTFIVR